MKCRFLSITSLFLAGVALFAIGQEPAAPGRPQSNADQLFKQFDKNGDGKLSAEEKPYSKLFKRLDKDGDGVVTSEEANADFAAKAASAPAGKPPQPASEGIVKLPESSKDTWFRRAYQINLLGQAGAVDGDGGYAWGGANGTQFWLDRKNHLFGVFMVQTQLYRSPAYRDFKRLVGQSLNTQPGDPQ